MKKKKYSILQGDKRGQGIVEFALIFPILILLVVGIFEFGRLIYIYSATVTASREAVRYGSAAGDVGGGIPHYQDCRGIRDTAKRVGVLLGLQDTDIEINYDLGTSSATCPPGTDVSPVTIEGGEDRILVRVTSGFQPIVPLVNIPTIPIQAWSARTIFEDIRIAED